ncbi:spermatid nuclear transition protein 3-like [Moschus berezovskii]|uniref:spermatid nuclear transition protein 3-like n=1 Tax=Moschus berezovskii TaxID=68408 RepID=UPI002444C54C|nr:spermatid nuclear transition protein 3-like [Moschus berezovskii]
MTRVIRKPQKPRSVATQFASRMKGRKRTHFQRTYRGSVKSRHMTRRVRRPLQATLRKKIRSYATQSKKVKKTGKPKRFFCSCARKTVNQRRKSYQNMRQGPRRRQNRKRRSAQWPQNERPWKLQPGQPVSEYQRSDTLELFLQRSAFLQTANQEKTDSHTNIVNCWLPLK